jgi:hypothetical protein
MIDRVIITYRKAKPPEEAIQLIAGIAKPIKNAMVDMGAGKMLTMKPIMMPQTKS